MPLITLTETETATAMKALSEPTRLLVVNLLTAGPQVQKQLLARLVLRGAFVDQSVLAYHMRKLCRSGLVAQHRTGVWVSYRLVPEMFAAVAGMLRPAGAR